MKISAVEMLVAPMSTSWLTEKVIANPMSVYEDYWRKRSSWYGTFTAGVVRVTAEDGSYGLGFVGGAHASAGKVVLEDHLAGLVVGRSGSAVVGTTAAGVVEVPLPAGTPVRTLAAGATEPALSPDERSLAFVLRP